MNRAASSDDAKDSGELRQRAEALARSQQEALNQSDQGSAQATLRLLHELQVHQIELELQNEELVSHRGELEEVAASYTELYDFAPTAHFTLHRLGLISRTNSAGAQLLGAERAQLMDARFDAFVAPPDRPSFHAFMHSVFLDKGQLGCELTLEVKERQVSVQVEACLSCGGMECRMVVNDVSALKQANLAMLAAQEEMTKTQSQLGAWAAEFRRRDA